MTKDARNMECDLPEPGTGAAGEIARLVRYSLTALGGWMIGQGYLQSDTVAAIVAIGTTATPILIGLIVGRTTNKKLAKAVEAAKAKPSDEG